MNFFQKKIRQENSGINDVNMTPLIDVSLVLVVMLLLSTPLAIESSIAVRNSAKAAATAEKRVEDERVEVDVISEDEVTINGRTTVVRGELEGVLQPLLDNHSNRLVVITCGDKVSHGVFVDVLDQVKLSGAADIAVTEK